MDLLNFVWQYLKLATLTDVLDILIVAYLLYRVVKLIRDTSAERLLKGIVFLLIVMQVSEWLNLNVINFILQNMMQLGFLAIVIVFQPELRKMLEQVGKNRFSAFFDHGSDQSEIQKCIIHTVEACSSMSWSKIGALIVFERKDKLGDIIKTGTIVDAEISSEIIKNIFYPKAPLHDGAMIVRSGRIIAAGCVLPLSDNPNLSRDLGTRHRAAVGMSERTDSLCVVVSEETGSISVASGGMLKRHLAPETLEKLLLKEFISENPEKAQNNIFTVWKGKSK
ncbi:MAG: diadenylate cyclase CdaA [Clostridiales bacterium]|nr:diadenylate cyclase CdaA [Clostridiales bacterium]